MSFLLRARIIPMLAAAAARPNSIFVRNGGISSCSSGSGDGGGPFGEGGDASVFFLGVSILVV